MSALAVLPPMPVDAARQAALDAYAIVDTAPEQAFDDIVRLAMTVCAVPAAAIALVDRDRVWFKARHGFDTEELPRAASISDRVVRARQPLTLADARSDARAAASPLRIDGRPLRFYAGVPLRSADGQVIGTVCVADTVPRTLAAAQREALEMLARQVTLLLELRRHASEQRRLLFERDAIVHRAERARAELEIRHERLLHTARRDELTGLLNRAALAQLRADPVQMRKLAEGPYSLILFDVDHFKQVNDRHGHLLGDRALRVVAEAVSASVREDDVAVRYGGEEFLVVLPNTVLAHAVEVAHRIRERVAAAVLPFALTISAGVAAGDGDNDDPEQVFERADQALYRAKAGGRDRVVADDTPRV